MLYPIEMFLPASIIAFGFVLFWSVIYPNDFKSTLKLQALNDPLYPNKFTSWFVTFSSYLFVFLSINLISYLF